MAANGITISPQARWTPMMKASLSPKLKPLPKFPMHPLPEMIQTCWRSNLTAQKKVVDRHRQHGEKATAK
jgi:hypothetical protein